MIRIEAIVDISITDSPRRPYSEKQYDIVKDRCEEDCNDKSTCVSLQQKYPSSVDIEGGWTKKSNIFRYGYKQHTAVDTNGLVLGVVTTSVKESDTKDLELVLNKIKLPLDSYVEADKGYYGKPNDTILAEKGLKNRIMKRAVRNNPLRESAKLFNQLISKTRYKVERTFGGIKSWFRGGTARYVGLYKMHTITCKL